MLDTTRLSLAARSFMGIAITAILIAGLAAQPSLAQKQPAKTALPDWSGLWIGTNASTGRDPRAQNSTPGPRPAPNPFSYTPEYAAKHEALLKGERGEGTAYDPITNCIPPGMPRILTNPYPMEIVILPNKVFILYEYFGQVRQIFTDGRKHPPEDELTITFNGHSIGHWEGDTLVVDTVGLNETTLVDRTSAHSDALHITERIRRTRPNALEAKVTLTDPKAFTKPWSTTYTWRHEPAWDLQEYVCSENNRNYSDQTGAASVQLPGAQKQ